MTLSELQTSIEDAYTEVTNRLYSTGTTRDKKVLARTKSQLRLVLVDVILLKITQTTAEIK